MRKRENKDELIRNKELFGSLECGSHLHQVSLSVEQHPQAAKIYLKPLKVHLQEQKLFNQGSQTSLTNDCILDHFIGLNFIALNLLAFLNLLNPFKSGLHEQFLSALTKITQGGFVVIIINAEHYRLLIYYFIVWMNISHS